MGFVGFIRWGAVVVSRRVLEGCVECDIQVSIAEEVGIIRNVMDDQRRVVRLGP